MGRAVTVVGILLSIGAAYFASMWTNAMDIIQLVFGFVNAPLFATFLLGMFWSRTTGTGAFVGLVSGTAASALFHACSISQGNLPGVKGAYLAKLLVLPSDMAQNFWLASSPSSSVSWSPWWFRWERAGPRATRISRGSSIRSPRSRPSIRRGMPVLPPSACVLLVVCVALNYIFW